ncbi:ADP-ribosylglycohydrolase family protein [uncultured Gimesia sp.]|uniref:ADP-ribosylglycohydrolase family protein n=1 Tax=uncultured Gimesia sp. TaxID=1678688 RepID=UPI0030D9C724|tara:strand:- start:104205 stop:104993 length:789 start_codon:yes stop_codon:yes gene_type:complete
MWGAIVGDVIGSYFEHFPTKSTDFYLFREESTFTDDTVLTTAVADWLLKESDLVNTLHRYVKLYPEAGYGHTFLSWAQLRRRVPYQSWGNGSAMRVSPVAYATETLADCLYLAKKSAEVTHNHQQGIYGAQATAACVFLARTGSSRTEIREYIETTFGYDLQRSLEEIRPHYVFDVSCQGSVPESIIAFLESTDYESAIRNAISLGGDADTMACIAGAIAEPFYGGVPQEIYEQTLLLLDDRIRNTVQLFYDRFVDRQPDAK